MSSSNSVNYTMRPNKTVERKLIFELLITLDPIFNFSGYRYIGLSALWFVDFVMAHKLLSISDMISIEKDEILASRARFNRPFGCIAVECGESDVVLPELPLEENPLLVWLDYDTSLDGPVLQDLSVVCRRAQSGSVLIATVNAHRRSLPAKDENDEPYENLAAQLRALAGDLVPAELPREATKAKGYPKFVASLLFDHMRRSIRTAGREKEYLLPLINIGYSDNAPMVTVGGAIVDERRAIEATNHLEGKGLEGFLDEAKHISIGVPPLTFKEKACLDQLMPSVEVPTEKDVEKLGFKLKPSQIMAYHQYYRHYPTFSEIEI